MKYRAKAALLYYFKFDSFRPEKLATLLPISHGRDMFAQMLTGAGKSLRFFLATSPCAVDVGHQPQPT